MNLDDLTPKTRYDFKRNFKLAKYPSNHWNPQYSHTLSQECFVKLWQTSNSLDEFMVKIDKINLMLSKRSVYVLYHRNPRYVTPRLSTESKGYIARATRYRNKGVAMKNLEWFTPVSKSRRSATDWKALAKLAEESA